MSPTLLEIAVALLLVWVAWQIGMMLAPRVITYFRRSVRPAPTSPPNDATSRARDAFRAANQETPHANDP